MSSIKEKILIMILEPINWFIPMKPAMSMYNALFESVSTKWVRILNYHVRIPNKDFIWKINLYNGESVRTRIEKGIPKSQHFAVGYKWHDPSLSFLEYRITEFLLNKNNSCFIDCGANLGLRSLTSLSKGLATHMIEPNEELNEINRKRCELNGFNNYWIHPVGVSDCDGQHVFHIDDSSYLSSLEQRDVLSEHIVRSETIEIRTLDTIFRDQLKLDDFNVFIKIDVENHEEKVLKGGSKLIEKHSPTLLIEIDDNGNHKGIFRSLMDVGYVVFQTVHDLNVSQNSFLQEIESENEEYVFKTKDFLFIKDSEVLNYMRQFVCEN